MTNPNVRFPAAFCEKNFGFLRGKLRFPAPFKCLNFQEKGSVCHLNFSIPSSAPRRSFSGGLSSSHLRATFFPPLIFRRRTNVQQLTCKIDLSNSFYYLFFSFVLIELKSFVLKGEVPGENYEKVPKSVKKSVKNYETILPFSCCPLVFP